MILLDCLWVFDIKMVPYKHSSLYLLVHILSNFVIYIPKGKILWDKIYVFKILTDMTKMPYKVVITICIINKVIAECYFPYQLPWGKVWNFIFGLFHDHIVTIQHKIMFWGLMSVLTELARPYIYIMSLLSTNFLENCVK